MAEPVDQGDRPDRLTLTIDMRDAAQTRLVSATGLGKHVNGKRTAEH